MYIDSGQIQFIGLERTLQSKAPVQDLEQFKVQKPPNYMPINWHNA